MPKKIIHRRKDPRGRRPKPGKLPDIGSFTIPMPKREVTSDGTPPEMRGTVELLHEKVRYALHLSACHYTHEEIAEQVGKRFECDPPARNTVTEWLAKYHEAADEDCVAYRNQKRQKQGWIIERLLKRWLPVALAENFALNRWRVVNGESVQVLDENAYDEQIKAAAIVIKLLEREAKLWGLELTKINEQASNSVTTETINYYISQQVALHTAEKEGGEPFKERLELHAGENDIDTA